MVGGHGECRDGFDRLFLKIIFIVLDYVMCVCGHTGEFRSLMGPEGLGPLELEL